MFKRALDIVSAGLGLLILSPLPLFAAALLKWSSRSPVLFRQEPIGCVGTPFTIAKFRTMPVVQGAEKGCFDAGGSACVTQFGRFLRKTKLDEIPQLWNGLKGDMSFVGPQTEVRKWVEAYLERWAKVLAVRPGITNPPSIYYRNEEELLIQSDDPEEYYRDHILPHKLDLYEEYSV